ncbi:hypothetical protein EG850_04620 [Gulosibacter macacae]|uniref:DUF4190 domain-containing protein n=1 Tax=Gulosibacter macacae TaxID=2488791 RepID=A0A3P3VXR8_9MICO|nr:hypothetical protein [Gulosibacter macacae]RRJ87591.1 hypothetical protein EG850_04620 [Gulosibacter macacae]
MSEQNRGPQSPGDDTNADSVEDLKPAESAAIERRDGEAPASSASDVVEADGLEAGVLDGTDETIDASIDASTDETIDTSYADEAAVPAAGGTFGIEHDASGFGAHQTPAPANWGAQSAEAQGLDAQGVDAQGSDAHSPAAEPAIPAAWPQPQPVSTPESTTVRELVREGNRQVPAGGGTFGVTVDESGYEAAAGRPVAGPAADAGFGVPAAPRANSFDGLGQGAAGREFSAPQFGTGAAEQASPMPLVALVLAVLALLILCLPGWAWIVGGVVGAIAIALGLAGMRGARKSLARLAVAGGVIAVLIAIATAVVVFFI